MTDRMLQKYDELLRERNRYRRELALYRDAFEVMIAFTVGDEEMLWAYVNTREADQAIRSILKYRAEQSTQNLHGRQPAAVP